MTIGQIIRIVKERGPEAALRAAKAAQEPHLVRFVKERTGPAATPIRDTSRMGKTARRRANGTLARYKKNKVREAEENRRRAKKLGAGRKG